MKLTIERAMVEEVKRHTDGGYRSMVGYRIDGIYNCFSLPVKLDVGSEVEVTITVRSAKTLQAVENEAVKTA